MRSAFEIANRLLEHGPAMSHLKLQKLLYISFGIHIADHNENLFFDPVEAWRYGPVVSSVYFNLQFWGSKTIRFPIKLPDGSVPRIDEDCEEVLTVAKALDYMGHKTAEELVGWTHTRGGAWSQTFDEQRQNKAIRNTLIRADFERYGWGTPGNSTVRSAGRTSSR